MVRMIKQKLIFKVTLLFLIFNTQIAQVLAQEHIIIPKFGAVKLSNNTNHLVDNSSFDFKDNGVVSLGVTYLYKIDNGLAFGVELFGYEEDIVTTENNSGDATIGHLYGVMEKFFNTGGSVMPYLGVGLGLASVGFDANVNGDISDNNEDIAIGLSYELFLGSEFKISKLVGVTLEYKYFDFDIDDDIDDRDVEFESDGHTVFVGVALHL